MRKKVTLFQHKNTHHTITCKKRYSFSCIHLQYHFCFCFNLDVEGFTLDFFTSEISSKIFLLCIDYDVKK